MKFFLAFMMCVSGSPDSECRWMSMDLPDLKTCTAMRRLVIQEARDEGFRVHAICAPIEPESGATASSTFPR
jgi:hypothetical protein